MAQIEPLLGENAEPDPAFFIESWTVGVTAASENYLRRHEPAKKQEPPVTAPFPTLSFVTFLNVDPVAPVASAASPAAPGPARKAFVAGVRDEEEAEEFVAEPLTFQSACRLLGVAATSTREQIRAAYRKMASRYHPDMLEAAGSADPKSVSDRMAAINEAYRLLCHTAVRQSA